MSSSLIWKIVGALVALAMVVWVVSAIKDRTQIEATLRYNSTPLYSTLVAPATVNAPATAANIAVAPVQAAPVQAAPQVSSDTKLIMDALTSMDLRQQALNSRVDDRLARLESNRSAASDQVPCDGCSSEIQRVSPRRY